ncbi:MAG: CcdB family protein [Acetobacteraceae bacterium]|nr:CcdB family protein [Acetobacteraceae bacterium]
MQHDLFVNPNRRMRTVYPFLVDLQADLVGGTHRVIAPLAPRAAVARGGSQLLPIVAHGGQDYLLMLTLLGALPAQLLRNAVGTVRHARFEITRGLDWLLSGI